MKHYNTKNIKFISRCVAVLGLTTAVMGFDIFPKYSTTTGLTMGYSVHAQSISDADLRRYAQAATAIENLRISTVSKIQSAIGQSTPPALSCHQPGNFNQLPENARNMAMEYCQQSEQIVRNNGLSVNQFNQIHQQVKQDSALQQRLKSLL